MKYDMAKTLVWTELFGTVEEDAGTSVVVSNAGNIFVGGYTRGDLGSTNSGFRDYFRF